jgi:ABC-type transport system involved in multi-copper enzyme maturation permease subunit
MNPFIKKEIRLVLPSWIAVLALAILVPWFSWQDPDTSFAWAPVFLFLGVMLLAVDSFGREFSLGTFSGLMAQPIERRKIWQTKISILFSAALLIFAVYFISSEIIFRLALQISVWNANPKILTADFHNGMFGAIAAILIALTGGLWTTLLLRQISAAFWITFLTPLGVMMLVIFFLPAKWPDNLLVPLLGILAAIYSITGFIFAHKIFHRAQDVAWTGGVISFSRWRYFEASSNNSISTRARKPFFALLKNEFQLHSISLFCAGALLAMHISVFFVRAFYGNSHKNSTADVISEFFWIFWLVMPLIIGCMAVAEERKLGVVDGQFCQPVSRRFQFIIKFFPALFFGVLLGGVMPMLLEALAARLGAPSDIFKAEDHPGNNFFSGLQLFFISVISLSAAFALIGFLASTLAKNFMHALSIAIVSTVAGFFVLGFFANPRGFLGHQFFLSYAMLCGTVLPPLIAVLTFVTFVPWLSWRNFSHFAETGRLWCRNIFGIIGAIVFVFVGSALIYNRFWEIAEPAEPAHGVAKFPLADSPKLQSNMQGSFLVKFSDGRVWLDNLSDFYPQTDDLWKLAWWQLVRPLPKSTGPRQFLPGSNWASTTASQRIDPWGNHESIAGYFDTVGIQKDGSLWISSEAKPFDWTGAKMVQFGDETNWQQVVSYWNRYLLLKTDGTLWQWQRLGTKGNSWRDWQKNWPTVRNFPIQQIGADSHWQEIFPAFGASARKTDGTIWSVTFSNPTNKDEFFRQTNLDQVVSQTFSEDSENSGYARTSYIGKDGTLWVRNIYLDEEGFDERKNPLTGNTYLQVGAETNWTSAAINWDRLVALKSDGSLWQWKLTARTMAEAVQIPPTRFSSHHDWAGIISVWGGMITLSADGNLWLWPGTSYYGTLLKAPKQPKFLANIFAAAN